MVLWYTNSYGIQQNLRTKIQLIKILILTHTHTRIFLNYMISFNSLTLLEEVEFLNEQQSTISTPGRSDTIAMTSLTITRIDGMIRFLIFLIIIAVDKLVTKYHYTACLRTPHTRQGNRRTKPLTTHKNDTHEPSRCLNISLWCVVQTLFSQPHKHNRYPMTFGEKTR